MRASERARAARLTDVRPGAVVAVMAGARGDERALDVACGLAVRQATTLVTIAFPGFVAPPVICVDPMTFAWVDPQFLDRATMDHEARERVEEALAGRPVPWRHLTLQRHDAPQLADICRLIDASMVVAPSTRVGALPRSLRKHLVRRAFVPVLVVP